MKNIIQVVFVAYLIVTAMAVNAASMMDGFTDPEGGMFDIAKGPEDTEFMILNQRCPGYGDIIF